MNKLKTSDVYNFLNELAPFSTQESWDNSGLLVGDPNANVLKVLVALDITHAALDEAEKIGANLIVSHHPVIFTSLSEVLAGSVVHRLIASGMSAICAHTNLDVASDGVNKCLASALSMQNQTGFVTMENGEKLGAVGDLSSPLSPNDFGLLVKKSLGVPVRIVFGSKPVRRVAVCGGAGGDFVSKAISVADAIVTAEIKHHQFIEASENGLTAVDATHFATEAVVLEPLARQIEQALLVPATAFLQKDMIKFI